MPRGERRGPSAGCARPRSGHDGAFLTDADGRRQLAGVLDADRLDAVRPDLEAQHGMALRALLADLDLAAGARPSATRAATSTPGPTCATSERRLGEGVATRRCDAANLGVVNLHDWIDELSDVLDIDTEVDEGLVLDLARVAAHNVARPAAPITTYLLGYAAGAQDADPEAIEAPGRPRAAARGELGPARRTRPTPTTSTTRSPTTARSTTPARRFEDD